jgi:hypothetical protein
MLKARVNDEIWLTQQPHHAQVSGYLAAHWGGPNRFVRPGFEPGATNPSRWRDEIVLGIAEHDNGWWETEAMPLFSETDGLPVGVGEAAPPTKENEMSAWHSGGFDRWIVGINRLATHHPYAALITSMHAYWLYAVVFDDLHTGDIDHRRHFVFGSPEVAAGLVSDECRARAFLTELAGIQTHLIGRLARDRSMSRAIESEHLDMHARLLQLFDSMSLYLALIDLDEHQLPHVPRASWRDRVSMTWKRLDAGTIGLDPYPFDTDGLVVTMPTRVVRADSPPNGDALARFHATPLGSKSFTFVSLR